MVRRNRNASKLVQPNIEEKYIEILRHLADLGPVSKTEITNLMFPHHLGQVSKQAVFKWVDELKSTGLIEPSGLPTVRGAERFDLTLRGLATLICSVSEQDSKFFSQISEKYQRFLPNVFDLWKPLVGARIDDIARRQLRTMCKLLQPARSQDLLRTRRDLRRRQRWRTLVAGLQPAERQDVESRYGLDLDQGVSAVKRVVEDWANYWADHFWLFVDESDYKRWTNGIRGSPVLAKRVARAKLRALLLAVVSVNELFGNPEHFTELLVPENFEQQDSATIQQLVQQIASLNKASKRMLHVDKWNRIRLALHSLGRQRS